MAEKVWFGLRRSSFSIIWSPQGQEPCSDGECPVVVGCLGEISVGSLFYYIVHVKGNHMMHDAKPSAKANHSLLSHMFVS